ncbi:MAG: HD domain-containing protein [Clostridia bacterium]|nr:HD domain-containing protein [Clostridia bacterium]
MKPKELLSVLSVAGSLKSVTRHCDLSDDRKESVAEHSWRLALLALLLEDEFSDTDINKVIRMCLIHDLGEAFTGDIATFKKTGADSLREKELYLNWVNGFPEYQRHEFLSLINEMEEMKTKEAKLYKALDKLEAVIQHNESDIKTWLPLEYDLQLTYGSEEVKFSSYLTELKEVIDRWTIEKIENESK